jgi:hypothetical protein
LAPWSSPTAHTVSTRSRSPFRSVRWAPGSSATARARAARQRGGQDHVDLRGGERLVQDRSRLRRTRETRVPLASAEHGVCDVTGVLGGVAGVAPDVAELAR